MARKRLIIDIKDVSKPFQITSTPERLSYMGIHAGDITIEDVPDEADKEH